MVLIPFQKLFDGFDDICANHEFLFEMILESSVLHKLGLKNADSVKSLILNTYEKEIMFSKSKLWIDSSNALLGYV